MKRPKIEIRRGRGGARLFRFVVIAANGEPIATSEHYKTKASVRKGIDALFAAFAEGPAIVDTTKAKPIKP